MALGRLGGAKGGNARAKALSVRKRKENREEGSRRALGKEAHLERAGKGLQTRTKTRKPQTEYVSPGLGLTGIAVKQRTQERLSKSHSPMSDPVQ